MSKPPTHSQLTENICLASFSKKLKRTVQFPNYNGHRCISVIAGLICEETGTEVFELWPFHLNPYFTQTDLLNYLGMFSMA